MVSASGKKWAKVVNADADEGAWLDTIYDPTDEQFVSVGVEVNNPIPAPSMRSVDNGVSWLFDNDMPVGGGKALIRVPQRYIVIPSDQEAPGDLHFSPDALSWSVSNALTSGAGGAGIFNRLAYSPSLARLVICGVALAGGIVFNYSDDDGDTWTPASAVAGGVVNVIDVIWSERLSLFIACGVRTGFSPLIAIWTSVDGSSWVVTSVSDVINFKWVIDATDMEKIVFVCDDLGGDPILAFTTDFLSFDTLSVPANVQYLVKAAYTTDHGVNGRIIVAGKKNPDDGYIAWTDDLITLTEATP